MSELERKAALADVLLEQMATISKLREENEHLKAEIEALEALNETAVAED